MPIRVLSIDVGIQAGFALIEVGKPPRSGSHKMIHSTAEFGFLAAEFHDWCDGLIKKFRPDVVAYAMPFIGKFATPAALEVVFGFSALVELVTRKRKINCVSCSESQARREFLTAVPRKSEDIKRAVLLACRQRGWAATDHHAADALCVAASIIERLDPGKSYQTTPLFTVAPIARRRSGK